MIVSSSSVAGGGKKEVRRKKKIVLVPAYMDVGHRSLGARSLLAVCMPVWPSI
jgi:hypothetical protein